MTKSKEQSTVRDSAYYIKQLANTQINPEIDKEDSTEPKRALIERAMNKRFNKKFWQENLEKVMHQALSHLKNEAGSLPDLGWFNQFTELAKTISIQNSKFYGRLL